MSRCAIKKFTAEAQRTESSPEFLIHDYRFTIHVHSSLYKLYILHKPYIPLLYSDAKKLYARITAGEITLAGNKQLRIYGTLKCKSGKRMKDSNRVFFASTEEAINAGYRPCGHCMHEAYLLWKKQQ